ncbi:hypothetical protein O181_091688 [Austropuccinia psidii MF-1]|uniref:Uncharacterized protein n=1 Tax=Austropuccinia psidii MF-1 TaxID=1389203 RepID=A0A9Q3P7Q8_9BASI|nr:hypothetical protein [Austropuccinia psidii MF-1]
MGRGPYTAVRGLWGLLEAPWAQFCWGPQNSPWPGPIERVQDHQDPGLLTVAGEVVVTSSELTELTESSPSVPPPSVLCGSGDLSQLASPSKASSGHFDPSQTYDGYKAVEFLDPSCTECLAKGKDCFQHYNTRSSKCHYCYIGKKPCPQTERQALNVRRYLWIRKDGPFGKEFPVSEAPTPDGTSGFSHSSCQHIPKSCHPHTPRNFQPTLATVPTSLPPASPSSSHSRPALTQAVGPSPILKPRNSPIITSQQLQPMSSSTRRRDGFSPFPFPAT